MECLNAENGYNNTIGVGCNDTTTHVMGYNFKFGLENYKGRRYKDGVFSNIHAKSCTALKNATMEEIEKIKKDLKYYGIEVE
jgi:hypothetical protein